MSRYLGMISADGRAIKDIAYRPAKFGESITLAESKSSIQLTVLVLFLWIQL